MKFNKKSIFIIIFLLFLTACEESCISVNDFGDSGDFYTLNVFTSVAQCDWNTGSSYKDNTNETIKQCLKNTKIDTISSLLDEDNQIESSYLRGIVNKSSISGFNCEDSTNLTEDNKQLTEQIKKIGKIEINQDTSEYPSGLNNVRDIFNECIKSCQDICSATPTSNLWSKAELKTANSLFGIDVNDNTQMTIKATGNVKLSDKVNTNEMKFRKDNFEEINFSQYLPGNTSIPLYLLLHRSIFSDKSTLPLLTNSDFIKNVNKIYLEFVKIKYNLLVDKSSFEDPGDKGCKLIEYPHFFQTPKYLPIKYDFTSSENNTINGFFNIKETDYDDYLKDCTFKNNATKNNLTKNLLSEYSIENLDVEIFDDYFYYYSNESINNIEIINDKINIKKDNKHPVRTSILSSIGNHKIESTINENNIFTDGYYWDDGKDEFTFEINQATKLAITTVDNKNSNIECEYSIKERINFSDNDPIIYGNESEGYFNYKNQKQDKYWTTIKKPNSNTEIVFNQYAIGNKLNNKKIITITNLNSKNSDTKKICGKILIKLLPMKDVEIKETGLLFLADNLSNKNNMNNSKEIKYTILNPNILNIKFDNVNEDEGKQVKSIEFTEFGKNEKSFLFNNIGPLKNEEIKKIDNLNNDLLEKSIFVREGQYLRLDYSNWLIVDEKDTIKMKLSYTTTVDENNKGGNNINIDIPYGISLFKIFVKKLPFICVGESKSLISFKEICGSNNGETTEIKETDNSENIEKCSLNDSEIMQCSFTEEEYEKYYKAAIKEYKAENYIYKITNIQTIVTNFLNMLSSGIIDKNIEAQTSVIFPIIKNRTKECLTYLKNDNFDIYKIETIVTNGGQANEERKTKHIKQTNIADLIDKLNSIDVSGKIIIENFKKPIETILKEVFFMIETKTEGTKTTIDGKEYDVPSTSSYTSNFTFFKATDSICNYDPTYKQCVVEGIPQCYNFKNYKGRLFNFIGRTLKNKNSISESVEYGGLSMIDRFIDDTKNLGMKKIESFNGSSGIINSFTLKNSKPSEENVDYFIAEYNNNIISLGSSSYLKSYKINDTTNIVSLLNEDEGYNYPEFIKNIFKSGSFDNDYLIVKTEIVDVYRNGKNLSIILGNNKYNYAEYPPENTTNVNDKDIKEGRCEKSCVIVKYKDGLLDPLSKYKFNEEGELINVDNKSNIIDLSTEEFRECFNSCEKTDPNNKNLFFKVIPVKADSTGGSGSYKVVINTKQKGGAENFILKKIRELFNTILTFLDGRTIKLLSDVSKAESPEPLKCNLFEANVTDTAKNLCTYYNKTSPEKFNTDTGISCDTFNGNENCYRNCKSLNPEDTNNRTKCVSYKDGTGFVRHIFMKFINNILYQFIIKIAFVLMLSFYGFNYFLGKSSFKQSEIIKKILKICFIYFMLSPNGWDFFERFVVSFFKEGIDSLLFLIAGAFETETTSDLLFAVRVGDYSDKVVIFQSGIDNLKMIFSKPIMYKMFGLIFSSWFGPIYFFLVFSSCISYIVSLFSAMILYLNAQLFLSLTFSLFPIVMMFLIFDKTKKSFDNWINNLMGLTFQQIFLVLIISFFNSLMTNLIKIVFSYRVCVLPIFKLKIGGIDLFNIFFYKVPTSGTFSSMSNNLPGSPNFYSIMMLYIIGLLMGKLVTAMVTLGSQIGGGGPNIATQGLGQAATLLKGAGDQLNKLVKDTGTKFAKTAISRASGADALKNVAGEQQKKLKDRTEARKNVANTANEKAEERFGKDLQNGKFEKELKEKEKEIDKDESLGEKEKKQKKEDMRNNFKQDKLKEYRNEEAVTAAMNNENYLEAAGIDKNSKDYDESAAREKMGKLMLGRKEIDAMPKQDLNNNAAKVTSVDEGEGGAQLKRQEGPEAQQEGPEAQQEGPEAQLKRKEETQPPKGEGENE